MDLYFYLAKLLTPIIVPTNLIFFSLIFSFYFYFIKNIKFFRKIFYLIFFLFFFIGVFPIGQNLIYYYLEKNFINLKIDNNFNYIFVPSGSPERLLKAIDIKNKNSFIKSKIIYSSGNSYIDKKRGKDYEYDFSNNLIKNSNIDLNDIIFLPNARNTVENFKQLNNFLSSIRGNKKILLVTSAFHIRRCLLIAKKYNIEISIAPSSYYYNDKSFSFINFYQDISIQKNLFYFDIFFKEMISIFVIKYII